MDHHLHEIYTRLFRHFGPQHWWPGETRLEIVVGAILTQNTNWTNVERAIANLKAKGLLSFEALDAVAPAKLAQAIKPSGYFNVKSRRLKHLIRYIKERYDGNLERMTKVPTAKLRAELLDVNGIGPETADSILLYAFGKPVFVVDAYTRRFMLRHNLIEPEDDYHAIQKIFMDHLPEDEAKFNEYHALIVALGKHFCRPDARCEDCPLFDWEYSLKDKCGYCHRAFRPKEKKRRGADGAICRWCYEKTSSP